MTIAQIYEEAKRKLDKGEITIGEFSEIVDREYQEPSKFIPVSERLPEKEGKYLVTTFSGGMYDVDTSYFFIWEDGETEWGEYGVESWMPLPQSPKGEQENG